MWSATWRSKRFPAANCPNARCAFLPFFRVWIHLGLVFLFLFQLLKPILCPSFIPPSLYLWCLFPCTILSHSLVCHVHSVSQLDAVQQTHSCILLCPSTQVLDGVMFNKDVTHPKMRRHIVNPRILLLDCPLEYKKGKCAYILIMACVLMAWIGLMFLCWATFPKSPYENN